MTIRVLVADDQPLMRAAFEMTLRTEEDIELVGEASDGLDAVEQARRLRPDVILMDVRMPGLDGVEATRILAAEDRTTKILILTTFDIDEYVIEAIRAGASGFLLKDVRPSDLIEAIRIVARGDALPPGVDRTVAAGAPAAQGWPARRADPDRAQGARARRPGCLEPRDRRRALRCRYHGAHAHPPYPREARAPRPCAGRRARVRHRARPAAR